MTGGGPAPRDRPTATDRLPPWRNDGVTNEDGTNEDGTLGCAVCGRPFRPVGRRRFCSDACRQTAWRRRHPAPLPVVLARPPRATVVYECPACGARLLGKQRCADCGVFCRRVGPGGPCPHCEEPVAVGDLIA